jgi:hypothetical protein
MRIYIYVDANGRDSMRGAKRTFRAEADRQRRALAAVVSALDALAGAIDRLADSADPLATQDEQPATAGDPG